MQSDFSIVDVFAEGQYSGNPLAVVTGAERLDDATMQLLAAEINYSETTFVYGLKDGGYRTRLFTPAREIAFAGHPILGTAWVVREMQAEASAQAIHLDLPVGRVTARFESGLDGSETVWFDAPYVTPGRTCDSGRMVKALGLDASDVDGRWPVQVMSAGTAAVVVPLRNLDALRRSSLNLADYADLIGEGFPPLVYQFCMESRNSGNDLSARFFFEAHGVREDPATGNGAAFLANYLRLHRVFPEDKTAWRIEQGYEVRRPSLVRIRLSGDSVQVGGRVISVVRGRLSDPRLHRR